MIRCDACDAPTTEPDTFCKDCEQNRAERAYERHCEDFHDGGCTRFNSLLDDQVAALRYK